MSHARFKSAPANRTKRETNSVAITCGEEQMKNVFGRSDSDKDGYLSKQELKKAFSDLGVEFPSLRAMSALWHADDNGDGRETNSVAITCGEEQMKNVFGRSDSDKDGYLSKQELKKAFSDLGVEFPSLRAMSALWHADDNGDNYISKKELAELVKYTSTMNTCTNK
ncbi:calmodulin-like protein 4 [Quercus suber]|uniref:Calmodulin-like protein 4 n=1 Tax=Quercus suber TaxID=58331 RepID=A0AAW0M8M8_QUESU